MDLKEVLHGLGTLLEDAALGGGSNFGLARGAALAHIIADALSVGDDAKPQLEQLAADIKVLVDHHGSPPRGHWEAMLERAREIRKIVQDAQDVAAAVKTSRAKRKGAPPPASPPETNPDKKE